MAIIERGKAAQPGCPLEAVILDHYNEDAAVEL